MLSSKSAPALVLKLKPSRLLAIYTILGHGLALSVLFYPLELPLISRLMILVFVMFSFIYHWNTREPVVSLSSPGSDKLWSLQLKDGRNVKASLHGETWITAWLIVLRFKLRDGGRLSFVILPDSGEQESIRQLRVYLRHIDRHKSTK